MEWSTITWISFCVLWLIVLLQVILTLALARLVGRLSRRMPASGARVIDPGPEIGTIVDDWQGTDLLGRESGFGFPRERAILALYMSPHCSTCTALLPSAKKVFREIAAQAEGAWVMVVGSREAQRRYAEDHRLGSETVVSEEDLPQSWRIQGAPFGIWINSTGEVKAKGMVNHREHLESLINAAETGYASFDKYVSAISDKDTSE